MSLDHKYSLHLVVVNDLTLNQVGQLTVLAKTIENVKANVSCVSETPHKIPLPLP